MARCDMDGREYAIKCYFNHAQFHREKEAYLNMSNMFSAVGCSLAHDMGLPEASRIVENSEQWQTGRRRNALPPCILFERGESLLSWAKKKPLEKLTALTVIRRVAECLLKLHSSGLVHMDLTPASVLWLPPRHAWTIITYTSLSPTGSYVPAHACSCQAPEVVQAVADGYMLQVCPAIDAWALGLVAFGVLMGYSCTPETLAGNQVPDSSLQQHCDAHMPWRTQLHSPEAKLKYGTMHGVLAALLRPDASTRPSMHHVVATFDAIYSGLAPLKLFPLSTSTSTLQCHRLLLHLPVKVTTAARKALVWYTATKALRWFQKHGCLLHSPIRSPVSLFKDLHSLTLRRSIQPHEVHKFAGHLSHFSALQVLDLSSNNLGCKGVALLAPCFARMAFMHTLVLGENSIGSAGAQALGPHLACMTAMRTLNLRWNFMADEAVASLGAHLACMQQMRALDLSSNRIGLQGAKVLGPHLAALSSLSSINLGWNPVHAEGVEALVCHLHNLSILQTLNLRCTIARYSCLKLFKGGETAFASYFAQMTSIQTLILADNAFSCQGAACLGPALPFMTALTRLDLRWNVVGDQGMKALAPRLSCMHWLHTLQLLGNKIGAEGARVLGPHLTCMTRLHTLDLGRNQIRSAGAQALAGHFACMTWLRTLNLRCNNIGSVGVVCLAPYLANMSRLQTLNLASNGMFYEGAEALGPHLSKLQSLQELSLEGNMIGCNGARTLAPHLSSIPSLQSLNLESNSIGSEGATALGSSLSSCNLLRTLNLESNSIGSDAAIDLGDMLSYMHSLQCVNLGTNDICAKKAQALRDALPGVDLLI